MSVPSTAGAVLLRRARVVDVRTGTLGPEQDVVITDGRIAAIGADLAPDGGPDQLDLAGAALLPGLVNLHTHFSLTLPGTLGDEISAFSPYELALYVADGARRTLHAGVTTVRCVAEKDGVDFALRATIAAGRAEGPRIRTAGRALVCTGGHGHEGSDTLECDGADGFRRGVRSQLKLGADLVKVMISGGIAGEHEQIDIPQLTADELSAVIETAHAWGRKVTAHAGPARAIEAAVGLGLDCVEHGYQLDAAACRAMAEAGTALVPTLVVTRCGSFFDELGVPGWMQQRSLGAAERHLESFRLAVDAGVEILLGSDMPPFWSFEGTSATVRELEHLSEAGLGPARALTAATLGPARWLGLDAELGTVEVGKVADLIACAGDPTASVSALRGLSLVMQAGRVVRTTAESSHG